MLIWRLVLIKTVKRPLIVCPCRWLRLSNNPVTRCVHQATSIHSRCELGTTYSQMQRQQSSNVCEQHCQSQYCVSVCLWCWWSWYWIHVHLQRRIRSQMLCQDRCKMWVSPFTQHTAWQKFQKRAAILLSPSRYQHAFASLDPARW